MGRSSRNGIFSTSFSSEAGEIELDSSVSDGDLEAQLDYDDGRTIEMVDEDLDSGNEIVVHFFNRISNMNMSKVFIAFLVLYIVLCVFFAVVLLCMSFMDPECIDPYGDIDFRDGTHDGHVTIYDAFILSWYDAMPF